MHCRLKNASLAALKKVGLGQLQSRAINKLLAMGSETQMDIISRVRTGA